MKKRRLVALFVAMMLLVSGCSNSQAPAQSAPSQNGETVQSAHPNKEYVFGIRNGSLCIMDPHKNVTQVNFVPMIQVYDAFFTYDDDMNLIPMLAESYEVNDECTVYTIHLKKGILFSNGKEMTAEDAKFSLDRAAASSYVSYGMQNFKDCKIIDDYTVQINMEIPDSTLLISLTDMQNGVVLCKEAVEAYGDVFADNTYAQEVSSIVGTGPYVMTNWVYGEEATFEANPNYWGEQPEIKQFKMKVIKDANTAAIAVQTGEVDAYLGNVPTISMETIKKDEDLQLVSVTPNSYYGVAMNTESDLFSNKDLRLAVCHGVDREKAMLVSTDGMGTLAYYEATDGWTANPNYKEWYEFDQEKARELVKKSGFEGATFEILTYAGNQLYENAIVSVADDLEKIGLKPEIVLLEGSVCDERVWMQKDFDMALFGNTVVKTDYCNTIVMGFLSTVEANGNLSNYNNPEVDALINKAFAESDIQARANIYADALKLINADALQVPLFFRPDNRTYSKEFAVNEVQARFDRIADLTFR